MGAAFVPRTKKVPVKNRHVPDHRRTLATVAAGLLLVATTLLTGATPAAAAPPATVTGQACAPGTGVTVAVDFAPGSDAVEIGCAVGTQATMAAAGAAAGFTFAPTTGFLATINGVAPADPAVGFWSIFINTTDGQPAGPLGTAWSFAQTGIDGGPLAVDTVLLFDLVEDFNAPQEDPRITLSEIAATAPVAPAPVAATPPATVTGQACLPGQGVTVAVDFAPDSDEVVIGCAIGTQTTMAAAGAGAGFTFAPTTGFLASINGVAPTDPDCRVLVHLHQHHRRPTRRTARTQFDLRHERHRRRTARRRHRPALRPGRGLQRHRGPSDHASRNSARPHPTAAPFSHRPTPPPVTAMRSPRRDGSAVSSRRPAGC